MLEKMRAITSNCKWKDEAKELLSKSSFSSEFIEAFHINWIESGRHVRSQIGDDEYLIKLLRHIFPKYSGGDILLYRGENEYKFTNKLIGLCWTKDIEIAKMFGRGLHAIDSCGLLLSCNCKEDWIITATTKRTNFLKEDEYIIDVSKISGIEILDRYEPTE